MFPPLHAPLILKESTNTTGQHTLIINAINAANVVKCLILLKLHMFLRVQPVVHILIKKEHISIIGPLIPIINAINVLYAEKRIIRVKQLTCHPAHLVPLNQLLR